MPAKKTDTTLEMLLSKVGTTRGGAFKYAPIEASAAVGALYIQPDQLPNPHPETLTVKLSWSIGSIKREEAYDNCLYWVEID